VQQTGENKNASYAAVFTFCIKAAGSVGIIICGTIIATAGIVSGAKEQTPEAVRNIALMCFSCGPIVMAVALLLLRTYPVTRESIQRLEKGE
jgi:Na+/melibiose symporter-like transporter